MVKCCFIELHHAGVAAFVFRMTVRTLQLGLLRYAAVKPSRISYIAANFRVAIDAQATLLPVRQWLMTKLAFRFNLGMQRNYIARHYKPLFDFGCLCDIHAK